MPIIYGGKGKLLGGAAANLWYLAGGIDIANCIAAYQPKGAASLAASYDNLTGNATYDANPEAHAPTWNSTDGWIFLVTSSQYLKTGYTPGQGAGNHPSIIVRYSGVGNGNFCLFGEDKFSGQNRSMIFPNYMGNIRYYFNGTEAGRSVSPGLAGGVLCVTNTVYKDGIQDAVVTFSWLSDPVYEYYIGARNAVGTADMFLTGNIQALAIYNTLLSSSQVLDVSTAMAAL
jgi:hypothetical protein